MKKILIALALCLVVVGLMASPALAAAQKVPLTPQNGETGSAFMVVNTSSSNAPDVYGNRADGASAFTVSLEGAQPNTTYDVWAEVSDVVSPQRYDPYSYYTGTTFTTNKQGNATVHVNAKSQSSFGIKLNLTVGYELPTTPEENYFPGSITFGSTLRFNNPAIVSVIINPHP